MVAKGVEAGRGMEWEIGVSRCKLLTFVVHSLSCVQLFMTLWIAAQPDSPVLQYLLEFAQIHVC